MRKYKQKEEVAGASNWSSLNELENAVIEGRGSWAGFKVKFDDGSPDSVKDSNEGVSNLPVRKRAVSRATKKNFSKRGMESLSRILLLLLILDLIMGSLSVYAVISGKIREKVLNETNETPVVKTLLDGPSLFDLQARDALVVCLGREIPKKTNDGEWECGNMEGNGSESVYYYVDLDYFNDNVDSS